MWAGDRRNCGKPSGLQYGCAYSNPTQKGEKERSTGELMAVVYIPKLEFKIKACNTCGKEIPKGDPCFWDKNNKKDVKARSSGLRSKGHSKEEHDCGSACNPRMPRLCALA